MNAKDIAYGYAIGYNDGIQNNGSGGGEDDDPDYALWQSLPEPASNQVIFVLHVLSIDEITTGNYDFMYIDDSDHVGDWTVPLWTIDWGDGATDTVTNTMTIHHRYTTAGRYIVTCTALADICRKIIYSNQLRGTTNINNTVLMVKYGADIGCAFSDFNYSKSFYLKYFKHKGNPTLDKRYFNNCVALKTVDIATPISIVYENMFDQCTSLKNVNLSAVTSIQDYGFRSCGLKKIELPLCTSIGYQAFVSTLRGRSIIAPICTSVGDYAFLRCYSLTNTVFADGCTFGSKAFQNCFSLYPRPDGSTD